MKTEIFLFSDDVVIIFGLTSVSLDWLKTIHISSSHPVFPAVGNKQFISYLEQTFSAVFLLLDVQSRCTTRNLIKSWTDVWIMFNGLCSSTEKQLLRSDEILGLARKPTMSHPAALYYFLTFLHSRFVSCSSPAPIHTASHWELTNIRTAPYWEAPVITAACNWSAQSRSTEAAVRVY